MEYMEFKIMSRSNFSSGDACSSSHFEVRDLKAQLAPLNLYGLGGVSAAVVDGLLSLAGFGARSGRPDARCAGN